MTEEEIINAITRLICPNPATWPGAEHIGKRSLGLRKDEKLGWIIEPVPKKCDRHRVYTTIIDLPDWLWDEPDHYEFMLGLVIYLACKLTSASRAIKSANSRSKAARSAIARSGASARWNRG